jgi:hypothetical protein
LQHSSERPTNDLNEERTSERSDTGHVGDRIESEGDARGGLGE